MRALCLLGLVGCAGTVRYQHAETAPAETLERAVQRAANAGWKQTVDGRADVRSVVLHDENGRGSHGVLLRATPVSDGTLLELSGETRSIIDKLAPDGESYDTTDQGFSTDEYHVDVTFDAGFAHSVHTDQRARIDGMLHLGHTVWRRGGDAQLVEPRRRVSVVGGVGIAVTNGPAFRPAIGVMIDTQDALTPFDRRLYTNHRKALSFEIATPIGDRYTSVEAGMTLHIPPWGGVLARAGYEWADGKHGTTYMVGARLDTIPSILVMGTLICVMAFEAAKEHDWSLSDFIGLPE